MRKVFIDEVKLGMVIAADIFDQDFGGDFPLIGRGVELTANYIGKMKERGVTEVLIITPPGYRGAPGETLVPAQVTEDILFEGKVELVGDIPPAIKIVAGENVCIRGLVQEGCSITSAKGDVRIDGRVVGSETKRVTINAANCVTLNNQQDGPSQYADIKAINEIMVDGDILGSTLSTKGKLLVNGKVERSDLYSQTRIRITACGDDLSKSPCQLLVKPAECRPLFQELLALDKQLAVQQKEKEKLQNTIDLIRKLGKNIEQLPPDKKMQLAADVRQFQQLDGEISTGQGKRGLIRKAIADALGVNRILITKFAHPNTKITIENLSLLLDRTMEKVAFYIKDMKLEHETIRE